MPRLRRKAAIRSEGHGAKRRAREGDIARRAMSRGRYAMRRILGKMASNGDGASAPSLLRGRGGRRAAEGRREGRERGASKCGAKRRTAMRESPRWERAAGDGSGATEPRWRLCTGSTARTGKRSAQRASASGVRQGSSPEGRRPRQRASWRRAGRSRARRNRARRPVVRPGGRPYFAIGQAGDTGPTSITDGDD